MHSRIAAALCVLLALLSHVEGRKFTLVLKDETRRYTIVSSFGLLVGGSVSLNVSGWSVKGDVTHVGMSIHRSSEESTDYILNQPLDDQQCLLTLPNAPNTLTLLMDVDTGAFISDVSNLTDFALELLSPSTDPDTNVTLDEGLSARFSVTAAGAEDYYTTAFHICGGLDAAVSLTITVVEENPESFLDAGQSPLPVVYGVCAALFGILSVIWVVVLYRCRDSPTLYKVHWLMLVLVVTKFFSLVLHAVDYHFIKQNGAQTEGWAITYYIINLCRGVLLFVTVLLVGAGYGFIKHVLSQKEKRLFVVVLTLQVISNVSLIVLEETSDGVASRGVWRSIGLLVDLACCAAILFPVIWSIRHLRESSQIDGKAQISLQKLKLFRRFYIMVLVYIYTTRIIVYLIETTISFRYTWTGELLNEVISLAFYTATGYMFSPLPTNEYFLLPTEDEQPLQMEEIVSTTGITEGLRPVNARPEVRETGLRQHRKAGGPEDSDY